MKHGSKIYIAGHQGLVGSSLVRALTKRGYTNLITRTFSDLDLRCQSDVQYFFAQERPEYVFLAAAKVGGIHANNQYPASFIYDNIVITTNVIDAAYRYGVQKLLFLGSSCIYPLNCPQPIKEEYLLTGELEKTNEAYAIAKIAGLKMCQAYNKQYGTNFISCMPTNLYGPGDTFDCMSSHVIPALIVKMYNAKREGLSSVTLWGTGKPRREFLYVDDLTEALLFLMERYDNSETINIGTGIDLSIAQLALLVKETVGFKGTLVFDETKPDGTPRKLLDVSRLHTLGWRARTRLEDGLKETISWYEATRINNSKTKCIVDIV